jgi:hypothetical protein
MITSNPIFQINCKGLVENEVIPSITNLIIFVSEYFDFPAIRSLRLENN